MNSIFKGGLVAALALGFSAGAFAFDHHGDKKHKMKDPMARAEMQCENARKEAAEGSDEDKAKAEEKCTKAMAKAKERGEKHKMKDPMARAHMQCENAKKEAAEGSDEDKAKAEEKCTKAMKKAEKHKMKMDKKAKKPKKDKDDDGTQ